MWKSSVVMSFTCQLDTGSKQVNKQGNGIRQSEVHRGEIKAGKMAVSVIFDRLEGKREERLATQRHWQVGYSACSVSANAALHPTGLKSPRVGEQVEGERAERMRSGCISLRLLPWAPGEKGLCFKCCEEKPFQPGLRYTHHGPGGEGPRMAADRQAWWLCHAFQAGCRWQHGRNPQLTLERVQEAQSLQAALEG